MAWELQHDNTVWTGKGTSYPAGWRLYSSQGWYMELSNDLSGGQTYAKLTALTGQLDKIYNKIRFDLYYSWWADLIIHYSAGADFSLYAEENTEYSLPVDRGYITAIEWTQLSKTFGYLGVDLRSLEFLYEEPVPTSEDYANAIDNPTLEFTSGGDFYWSVDTVNHYNGSSSVKSGIISDSKTSWLQTTVFGPVNISFFWKVSSEQNFDFLTFYIDGIEQDSISGEIDWQKKTYSLPSGLHILKWEYAKDSSVSVGSDCGWVDYIQIVLTKPDSIRNETIFRLTLSGNSGDRTNWIELFDNTVWTGKATAATAVWNSSRWEIQVGTKYGTDYASLTAAGADFDTFRPSKLAITFTGAEYLDIILHHANGQTYETADYVSGSDLFIFWDTSAITKIEFKRDDVYELYPYITDIQFYDADFVPTVNADAVIPLSNCNIQFRIEWKDENGETLPAWESGSNPFGSGYDSEKCLYRISFTGTAPSLNHIADFVANAGNELIFEYSIQTVNGEQDWHDLTFLRSELQSAIPQYGAQSQSITFQAENEKLVSDYTWDYQEVDISGVSFRSPNQTGGKWTYNMAGLITGLKPGYKAIYNGESFVVGEIQYIISTTGIQTYLKEY